MGIVKVFAGVEFGRPWLGFRNERNEAVDVTFADTDRDTTKLAAGLKARYGLPYADSFAAALAIERGGKLVTADRKDFASMEKSIQITWLG